MILFKDWQKDQVKFEFSACCINVQKHNTSAVDDDSQQTHDS